MTSWPSGRPSSAKPRPRLKVTRYESVRSGRLAERKSMDSARTVSFDESISTVEQESTSRSTSGPPLRLWTI